MRLSFPADAPFAVRGTLREAPVVIDPDIFDVRQLSHFLNPAGHSGAPGGLRRKIGKTDVGAVRSFLFDAQLAAVVERTPHLSASRQQRGWSEHSRQEAKESVDGIARRL